MSSGLVSSLVTAPRERSFIPSFTAGQNPHREKDSKPSRSEKEHRSDNYGWL